MYKVKVENEKQLDISLLEKKVKEIILSRDSFAECDLQKYVDKIKKTGKTAWIMLERISRYEESMKSVGSKAMGDDLRTSTDKIFAIQNLDGIIIQNLDSFAYMLRKINKARNRELKIELNYTMNCYNYETKMLYEKLYNEKRDNAKDIPLLFTSPLELNIYELSDVKYDTIVLYSYIDTMVSANCLYKNTLKENNLKKMNIAKAIGASAEGLDYICKYRFDFNKSNSYSSYIVDRKGKKLHYKTYCKYCYNKIFNVEPLFLLDKTDEIEKHLNHIKVISKNNLTEKMNQGLKYRIDFSFENEKEVKEIFSMKCPESFTRGHYKNSIK